jgi:hypothetical protein
MASFTDQFDRKDPFNFKPLVSIPAWPRLIQRDAKSILDSASETEVKGLAALASQLIADYAAPEYFHKNRPDWLWERAFPKCTRSTNLQTSSLIRIRFGDIHLLMAALEACDPFAQSQKLAQFKIWDLLSAFALWKLVDASDLADGYVTVDPHIFVTQEKTIRLQYAAELAMEAQAAVTQALQLKERELHLYAALNSREKIARLEKALWSAKGGNAKRENSQYMREEVIRLNKTKRFFNQGKLGDWLSDQLLKKFGETVQPSTTITWLREAGETKRKKRS